MSDLPAQPDQLHGSDPQLLAAAVAANHREFFIQHTRAVQGEVLRADGVTWTYAGRDGDSFILFPQLAPEQAGAQLDTIVQFYLKRQPTSLVGCWSLDPPTPPDLDIRLLARGFQPGWRPCWMWLDLALLRMQHPQPNGLRIELLEAAPPPEAPQLPYYDPTMAPIDRELAARQPRQVWHFMAWLAGEPVGHSRLFVTSGPLGVAGIYDVGVLPHMRNRGVGKAVTAAACRQALALGYRHALLNATGERMYQRLGFERIGYGSTWWLNVARLAQRPPSSERVKLAEAVGRGDLAALAGLAEGSAAESLDTPLANQMTLLELAAHAIQPAAAEWLVGHGATLDVLSAWDLGWRDRAAHLLAEHPERANHQHGERGVTPLHEAVERDDHALAQLLLEAGADLDIKDAQFGGTPLGWARHLQRAKMVELLERSR
jgi:GNAT superfamily N-acetyltransferase